MWQIEKQKGYPVYQQIIALIMHAVEEGELFPGEKLPSERKIATDLGVNRSTVVHALDELVSTGVIIRKQGSGTYINDGKWGLKTEPAVNWRSYLSHSPFERSDPYIQRVQSILASDFKHNIDAYSGELARDLVPDFDIPKITWQTFLREEMQEDSLGYLPLRKIICQERNELTTLNLIPEQLLLTNGAQQALFLILQVLLQPGDAVAIENPSSLYSMSIFQAAGIRLYGIPVDENGMQVELLEKEILRHKIKMVITNPTFQNPTGTVMSLVRRKNLVGICQRYRIPIVEDDVFGQLNFGMKHPIETLKSLDSGNVLYIGSLSKFLGATTKIGWISAPLKVTEKLANARHEMDVDMSIFPQVIAYYALNNPSYSKQIKKLNDALAERATLFANLVKKELGKDFSCHQPVGGHYIWVNYLHGTIGNTEMEFLLDKQLLCAPSFIFGLSSSYLRFNLARLTQDEVIQVISILEEAATHWKKVK